MSNSKITAVLFDYDGVLVNSEPLHWAAWGKLMEELEIPYNIQEIKMMAGQTAPQVMSFLAKKYRPEWTPSQHEIDALASRKNDFYLELAPQKLKTYPGVTEGLTWLREKGISCAIVSTGRRREILATSAIVGIQHLFDLIVSREDAAAVKPDPEPYLFAARRLNVQPSNCLAVEDSPPGLTAALLGNIPAAAVTNTFNAELLKHPVPDRLDLSPVWLGPSMDAMFTWLKSRF
jgi:beta-phosphoglucomutase